MSCGVGCRRSSYPVFLWLGCRLATAALIRPLAWEPPYATSAALKSKKQQQKTPSENYTYSVAALTLSGHWVDIIAIGIRE